MYFDIQGISPLDIFHQDISHLDMPPRHFPLGHILEAYEPIYYKLITIVTYILYRFNSLWSIYTYIFHFCNSMIPSQNY